MKKRNYSKSFKNFITAVDKKQLNHAWQMRQLHETPFQLLITSLKVPRIFGRL